MSRDQIGVNVDLPATHIKCDTYLDTDHTSPWPRRLLDTLLSRGLEAGVVLLWHGIWTLMDLVTEEEAWLGLDRGHSAWLSLALGWSGGLTLLLTQVPILRLYHCSSSRFWNCMFHVVFYIYILLGKVLSFKMIP